uniref:Uncharacterized protein n=1 Tax=Clastoptera arizonana TaxID=38151 RepID=A0A1B6E4M8_9HEMI
METRKIVIKTKNAPEPLGPYSQAIVVGNMVYVSGVIGLDPKTNELVEGGVQNETTQVLLNLGAVLEAAKSSFSEILKTTIFLENMNDFAVVNEKYKNCFKNDFPARSTIQVAKLPKNAKVEIEVIATTNNIK